MQRTSCGAAPPSHGSAVCNWSTQCTAEARQALSTILYTPRTQGCSCALCPAQKPEQQPSLHLRAGRDWVLPETLQKVTPHKHPVLCSGQGCAVFHQTPDQLSTRAVLLWVTACLQQNMVRSSVQHCRGNWLSSAASVLAAQHGGRAGERGSPAITWLRCAPGMTHLKKSESNLQQTNYIVKSPSFSVLWECSPRILISLASSSSEMIWWVFFQKKIPLDRQTAHCTHWRLDLYCIPSVLSRGPPAPLLSVQGLQVWEGAGTVKSLCFKSRICSLWIFLIKYFKKCYFGKRLFL